MRSPSDGDLKNIYFSLHHWTCLYWILGQTLMYIISSICLYADATYRFEDFVVVITELSLINDSSVLGGDEIAQSSRGTAYKNKYDNSLPYVEMMVVIRFGTLSKSCK